MGVERRRALGMADPSPVHYLPIASTFVAGGFAWAVLRRYVERGGLHLLWWGIGLVMFGIGTAMESYVTLFGWEAAAFRAWYVAGALMGGAPLAQGTAYLLLKRQTAHIFAGALVAFVLVAATFVVLSPIDMALVQEHRLSGKVMAWSWARLFSPFVNTYALVFLVGGAIVSALRFRRAGHRDRFYANALIAAGGLLPGIGGAMTRFGNTEALYVTELLGLLLIYAGYRFSTRAPPPTVGAPDADATPAR